MSLRFKGKLRFAIVSLCFAGIVSGHVNTAKASVFDPAYDNPVYSCGPVGIGPGCCRNTNLVRDMFEGAGLYAGQPDLQQFYYMNSLWPKFQTALMKLADELRNARLFSIGPRGAFIDAQTFNLTLLSLEKQTTQTLVTQTPSDQICRFGTLSTSLARSQDRSRIAQIALANQMMQRELMRSGLSSAFEKAAGTQLGRTSDKLSRFDQYKKRYCDPNDSNGALGKGFCSAGDLYRNVDIDITKSLFNPLTLNIGFTDSTKTPTDDETNIFSLSNNLFAHDLPLNVSTADFDTIVNGGEKDAEGARARLVDYRSLVAKRTVAQNSFAALAAMKAYGSGGSAAYMKQMIGYLGLDASAQAAYLGDNPSYYAQMELLTRKLYQSPQFYANLMDSPSNIARQQAAMEGIGLMQDRDIYESLRRTEMVLSTLLEMDVTRTQDKDKDRGTKKKE